LKRQGGAWYTSPRGKEAPVDLARSAVGRGIYSVSEVARLTGINGARVRRYVWGYRAGPKRYEHVFEADYASAKGARSLSFLDMAEINFIDRLRHLGLGLQTLRRVVENASRILRQNHPLSSPRIRRRGKSIFADLELSPGERKLIDLVTCQHCIRPVLLPFLDHYDHDHEKVRRWYPLGKGHGVVVDPERAWGRPIVPPLLRSGAHPCRPV
jgi:DNA-binding transcriptional MerR regulator